MANLMNWGTEYNKHEWANNSSPELNAQNLGEVESELEELHARTEYLKQTKAELTMEAQTLIRQLEAINVQIQSVYAQLYGAIGDKVDKNAYFTEIKTEYGFKVASEGGIELSVGDGAIDMSAHELKFNTKPVAVFDGTQTAPARQKALAPAWNSQTAYNAGDVVGYDGFSYKAKVYNVGVTPTNTTTWEQVAISSLINDLTNKSVKIDKLYESDVLTPFSYTTGTNELFNVLNNLRNNYNLCLAVLWSDFDGGYAESTICPTLYMGDSDDTHLVFEGNCWVALSSDLDEFKSKLCLYMQDSHHMFLNDPRLILYGVK